MRCYRYNNDACCNSVHDQYIDTEINNLLTPSCLRKYPELEDLFCLGCHPAEPYYTNRDSKIIDICLSFVVNIWNSTNIDSSTTRFDNCGFKVTQNLQDYTDKNYIIPSQVKIYYKIILINN